MGQKNRALVFFHGLYFTLIQKGSCKYVPWQSSGTNTCCFTFSEPFIGSGSINGMAARLNDFDSYVAFTHSCTSRNVVAGILRDRKPFTHRWRSIGNKLVLGVFPKTLRHADCRVLELTRRSSDQRQTSATATAAPVTYTIKSTRGRFQNTI